MNKNEVASIMIGKLLNIGGMLERKGNQLLQPFHLNQQQFSILYSISQERKVNQKNMVNKLVLEKAHVSKVVKKLSRMGLIEIIPSTDDKRSSWLIITPKGKEILHQCKSIINKWNEEWIGEIEDDQLQPILDSLSLIQDVFKNKANSK